MAKQREAWAQDHEGRSFRIRWTPGTYKLGDTLVFSTDFDTVRNEYPPGNELTGLSLSSRDWCMHGWPWIQATTPSGRRITARLDSSTLSHDCSFPVSVQRLHLRAYVAGSEEQGFPNEINWDVDDPGIIIKRKAIGGLKAKPPEGRQADAAAFSYTPFAPVLSTAAAPIAPRSAGCTEEQVARGCMYVKDRGCVCPTTDIAARGVSPTADRPGSISIFPRALQRQTVRRRYAKRRPGQ